MNRFFVSPEDLKTKTVYLVGDEFHHLKNVRRMEEGEHVQLLDGKGHIADAVIKKIEKRQAVLQVLEVKQLEAPPLPRVEIVLSLPRFQKMDIIIQKSVELDVAKIVPVFSDRSFLRNINKELSAKMERWNKIALEACKQSGQSWPLIIDPAENLETRLQTTDPQSSLFLYEGKSNLHLKEALNNIQNPKTLSVFIGAEGGFSSREVDVFQKKGIKPVTLGALTLRVETACIAIASIIKYHFNLM